MRMLWWIGSGVLVLFVAACGLWLNATTGIETPDYAVSESEGSIELRDYPALRVAEVMRQGSRREAVRAGFRPLAAYIFADEREGDKIAMTAPVTQTPEAEGPNWTVRFVMPRDYDLAELPAPADGSEVTLRELPPQQIAAIRFSGVATDETVAEAEDALRDWIFTRDLTPVGPATIAYYNDPLTPGPLRRNEVLIEVAPAG
ncbi:MAG: heme-binding protein [Pseudomonadota bacterium]